MSSILQNWLDDPGLSHVQAVSLRLPGSPAQTQVVGSEMGTEDFDDAMDQIAPVVSLLAAQGLLPGQVSWNFARGRLYYVLRADQAVLGLYCKRDTATNSSAVAELIAEFIQERSVA